MPFVCLQLPCLAGGHIDYSWRVLPKGLSDPPKLLLCSQPCCRFLNHEPPLRERCLLTSLWLPPPSLFCLFSLLWVCEVVLRIKSGRILNQPTSDHDRSNREGWLSFPPHARHDFRDRIKALSYEGEQHCWDPQPTKGKAVPLLFVLPGPSQGICRGFLREV